MVVNHNLSVGIFVSVALALLIGMTLWLTGKKGNEPTTHYSILFDNKVSGLMLGGPVFYLGVEVGEVTEMEIVKGDPVRIRVDIEVLESAPVNTRTWASLALQGITGVSIINLSSDPGPSEPLQKTPGYDYPLIEQRDTGFSALMESAPDIMTEINKLLESANALLAENNLESISQTLAHIESLTASVAGQDDAIAALPAALNNTLTDISATMAELKVVVSDAQPGIVSSVENLSRATADLAAVTEKIEAWVDGEDDHLHDFVNNGLGQVPDLITDMRNTMRAIEKLLREIREDPSDILYRTEENAVAVEP